MASLTEERFAKRSCLWAFLLGTLPQVLRIFLNFIYAYEIEGNIAYDTIGNVLLFAVDFLGPVSFFAGFGVVIYVTFLYGMKAGGEWLVALYGAYGLVYLLLYVIGDYSFGVVAFAFAAALFAFMLFSWLKGGRRPIAVAAATLCLPILGGTVILFATSAPSSDILLEYFLYGVANLGFELLLLVTAGRLANAFRLRAIEKGGNSADIAVGRKLFPWQNPVLAVCALIAAIYVILLAIDPAVYAINTIREYGLPVNAEEWMSLFYSYLELLVIYLVGYAVMLLTVGRIENAFILSQE